MIAAFKVDFKSFQDQILDPKWVNLYGPPPKAKGEIAEKMVMYGYDIGTCYRGRVLYSISSYNQDHPKNQTSDI